VASFISNIVTKFTAEGADAVASATDNVTKSQTRLANTSSSTGRQFAAQSQGLGGLVAAYAGAAANIFAITQAYEALSKAARIEQTIEGTKALASQIGESSNSIITSIKNITNGQLSIAKAAEITNSALSAGFDSKQLVSLTEVAFKASRVLGRDLSDSIDRVIKGTAKLEPELLDELGIFTRIQPAIEKYAASLGVNASSLTEFQRRQAFANATIEEGQRKFGVIAISSNSTQASFEKLAATFSDLTQKIGAAIAGTLAPALDFLSKNIGTAFLALAAVGSIVFKNLLGQVGGFVTGTVKGLEDIANSTKLTGSELVKFSEATTAAQKAAGTELKGRFIGAGGVGTSGKEAIDRAKAGDVSRTQMAADIPVLKALAESEAAYQEKVKDSTRSNDAKTRAIADSQARMATATTIATQYGIALDTAGKGTKILTGLTVGLQTAMRYAAVAINIAGTALNVIGIIIGAAQLIGTIFDIDILGAVGSAWQKLTESSKNLQAGIEGISASILNASSDRLRGLFSSKEIEAIAKDAQQKINDTLKISSDSITAQQKKVAQATAELGQGSNINPQKFQGVVSNIANLNDADLSKINSEFNKFGIIAERVGNTTKVRINDLQTGINGLTTLRLQPLVAQLASVEKQIEVTPKGSPKLKELQARLEGLKAAIIATESGAPIFARVAGELSKLTDIPTSKITESLQRQKLGIDSLTGAATLNGVAVGKLVNDQLDLNKTYESYVISTTKAEIASKDLSDTFATGNANSEGTSKILNGLINSTKELENSTNKLIETDKLEGAAKAEAIAALEKQKQKTQELIKTQEFLIGSERMKASLEKQFSSERQNFEEGAAKGLIDLNGKIAESDLEVAKNRMSFLSNAIAMGQEAKQALADGNYDPKQESTLKNRSEAARVAVEAAVGASFSLAKITKEINNDLDKRLKTLEGETAELRSQNELSQTRRDIALTIADAARVEADRQSYVKDVLEVQTRTIQSRIDLSKTELSIIQSRLDGEQAILEARGKLAKAGAALAVAKEERAGANALGPLKLQEQTQAALPNLYSNKEKLDLATAIARTEYDNAIKIINLKERESQADFANQIRLIDMQKQRLEAELASKQDEIKNTITLQANQAKINESNRTAEANKLSTEISLADKRRSEINQSLQLEVDKVNISKEGRLQELEILRQRLDIVKQEATTYKAAIEGNTEWVNGYIKAVNLQKGGNLTEIKVKTNFDTIFQNVELAGRKFDESKTKIEDIAKATTDNLTKEAEQKLSIYNKDIQQQQSALERVNESIRIQKELDDTANSSKIRELEQQKDTIKARIEATTIERDAKKTEAAASAEGFAKQREDQQRTLEAALQSIAIQRDSYLRLANEIAGIINSNLNKGVDSFFDAIKNGTLTLKNFKEGVVGVFRDILFDIAKAATKELLVKPITDAIGSALRTGLNGLFDQKTADAIVGPITKASTGAAGDLAKGAAGAATGQCGCIGDALSKVAPGAAGAATDAATKAAAEAAAKTGTDAAVKAASQTIETAPAGIYDNISNPVLAGASGYTPAIPDISGSLVTRGIGQSTIPAFGTQQLTSPAELGAAGITTSMAPAGFQSTFGVPGSFAGGNTYSTGDYNTLTGTYTRGSYGTTGPQTLFPGRNPTTGGEYTPGPSSDLGGGVGDKLSGLGDSIDKTKGNIEGLGTASIDTTGGMQGVIAGSNSLVAAKDVEGAASGTLTLAKESEEAVTVASEAVSATDNAATTASAGVTEWFTSMLTSASSAVTSFIASLGAGGAASVGAKAVAVTSASGGMVDGTSGWSRFAGGGLKMRDSVPALLEPGEFVMKKSSVDSIGRSAMERMNATGRSGGPTNIKVQVENQGQPKEAEQGQTQIDGETAIVKLILKDLSSNGPIRRTIRGGM